MKRRVSVIILTCSRICDILGARETVALAVLITTHFYAVSSRR